METFIKVLVAIFTVAFIVAAVWFIVIAQTPEPRENVVAHHFQGD